MGWAVGASEALMKALDIYAMIYARLNNDEWRGLVRTTYTAHVGSAVAGRLSSIGPFDFENLAPAIHRCVR